MSSSRPACPPMNTKPSWIRIELNPQQARHREAPARATTHETPRPAAAARDDERYAQKIEALGRPGDRTETAIPAAPIAT